MKRMNLPKGRPRPPIISPEQQTLIRAHIAAGGTWKTFTAFDVKQATYYNVRAGRGKYKETHHATDH